METVPLKSPADIRVEIGRIANKVRDNGTLLRTAHRENRRLLRRLERLYELSSASSGSPVESESSDLVSLSATTEHSEPPAANPEPVAESAPPAPLTREGLSRMYPQFANQVAIVKEAKRRAESVIPKQSEAVAALVELFTGLKKCMDKLMDRLQVTTDPASEFRFCAHDTMMELTKLIDSLSWDRINGVPGLQAIPESAVQSLGMYIEQIWQHIDACDPARYQKFELQPEIKPTDQYPVSVDGAAQLFSTYLHEASTKAGKGEVVRTVLPGFCFIDPLQRKKLHRPAWVVISKG